MERVTVLLSPLTLHWDVVVDATPGTGVHVPDHSLVPQTLSPPQAQGAGEGRGCSPQP